MLGVLRERNKEKAGIGMTHERFEPKNYFNADEFYNEIQKRMKQSISSGNEMFLMTLDLNRFSYINDLFGFETGDMILKKLTTHFSIYLSEGEFFTRIHADVFAFCIFAAEYTVVKERFLRLVDWEPILRGILPKHYSLTGSGGIVVLREASLPISAYLDKANYARQKAKGTLVSSVRFYDEKMDQALQWQKVVAFSMESALENREFEMYLQPKLAIKSDSIVGAEALVRWNNPQHGLIAPDRFIPILEQNGFIRQVDFFMLEEACHFLKKSAAKGIAQLPISINFSKVHLSSERLVEQIFQTVNRVGIDTRLIEIEFTESLSIEGFERLIEVVTDLKLLGFKVSLDDFGSAYSSLNCLKELPIDMIKIDKGFLDASSNSEKGKLIIAKVMEMIKSLRMISVMEGVETQEQVDFLRKLSCDFCQGYFYAKPMPQEDYVAYLQKGNIVSDMEDTLPRQGENLENNDRYIIPQEFQMDNWELYTLGKNIDMGLMKGYLDGEVTVQYVNDRALEYLGYTRQEFREIFYNSIVAFTHPDDAHIVQKNAEQLITTGRPLEFRTRAIRKDGKVIVLQGRSSCVMDDRGRPVGLYAFQDVTEELERVDTLQTSLEKKITELEKSVEALRLSEERYRAIVEQSGDVMFDWDFATDTIFFSDQYVKQFGQEPICNKVRTNSAMRERIHPDDLHIFEGWVAETYKTLGQHEAEFRKMNGEGHYVWLRSYSSALCDNDGQAVRAVGLLSNISTKKYELDALTYKSQRDSLTGLLNKEETRLQTETILKRYPRKTGALFIVDIDNFKGINDNLGHQLGDAVLVEFAQRIQSFFTKESIVGRIGGDEIAVYMPGVAKEDINSLAKALMQALRVTYYGSAAKYNVYASVGIALYPAHGRTFDELYYCADVALYESKNEGKDCFMIYQKHMTGSLQDNRTPVDLTEGFLGAYFQEDFPFQIFEMLYETKDMRASVQMILELLGKRFQVDRVYIFQRDASGDTLSNTHEWCAPGIPAEREVLQHIPYEELETYTKQYSSEGVYCCPDIRTADEAVYELCAPQGIKSMVHCAIYNEGMMAGFIGFDMCSQYYNWTGEEIATLGYLSRILSVFLLKSDIAFELRTSYQNYVGMIENLNGYVYVVDPTTYEVLYVNNAIHNLGLKGGQPCYQMAYQADSPCPSCPINQLGEDVHYATEEIYSQVLDGWVSSAASTLKWEGKRDAVLVCCMDISKYKQIAKEN